MIRRDYILRMIEEIIQALARIRALRNGQQWQAAESAVDGEFNRLLGRGAKAILNLSETELVAKLMSEGPTQMLPFKAMQLVTLLKEAGDIAAEEHRLEESRAFHLKGLSLLLGLIAGGELDAIERPEFVPSVDAFVNALEPHSLPPETAARLMLHYERLEDFGKAEDILFDMIDAEPNRAGLIEFGTAFYSRLAGKSDAALQSGNLPRAEVEAGLADLRSRAQ